MFKKPREERREAEGRPSSHETSPVEPQEQNGKRYDGGSVWRSLLILLAVFTCSALIVVYVVYRSFPALSDDELHKIKIPRDIDDAKTLGTVLSKYNDTHYTRVLVAYFTTYIFLQTFAIPGSVGLSVLSGYLYPLPLALFLVCLCAAVGSSLCYMLSYLVGRPVVHRYFPARAQEWSRQVEKHRDHLINYIIFLRITPLLPNAFINVTSPVIDVPLGVFFLGTFIGVAPLSFVAVNAGVAVDSLKNLPHVLEYEVVTPQKLGNMTENTFPSNETYPSIIRYSLTIAGQNYTLHLEKNRNLVGGSYSVTHYSEDGTQVTDTSYNKGHCFYHGHILEVEESSASIGLCSGVKGFVQLQDQVYLVEPLTSTEPGHQTGFHAVYNYKHLRRKRSSCSNGNTTTFFDHVSGPSGLFQLSGLKSRGQTKTQTGKPRIVEMVLVVDNTEYKKFGSRKSVETRMLEVANHVDKLYRPVGVRVMLVGLEMWSYRDQIEVSTDPNVSLVRFLEWRQKSLLPRTKHDNAQFVTAVDFDGSTVGLANTNAMCTANSGAVNEDRGSDPIGVASTIAHEMGHNLGLSHDTKHCTCGSSMSAKGCIMGESVAFPYPHLFSSCSQQQLRQFLDEVNPSCLLDTPSTNRIYGGAVCGNAYVEPGEECDCGTLQECKNPCCNATTCKLKEGAKCAEGECCHNCQLKPTGTMCRPRSGDCDLTEFCTGFSASCPTDVYAQNGLPCDYGRGYCYNGQCPSHKQHCKRLWGPDAEVAADACFRNGQKCKRTRLGQRCSDRDLKCGALFCSGGWEYPVTSRKSYSTLGNGEMCNEATIDPKDNYPSDLGMVPTGTKCGHDMVCYNQQCEHKTNIKSYGTEDCSAKCNNNGVCNHERQCHCHPGWAPPFCDIKLSEMPTGPDFAVVAGVASTVAFLVLLVVVIGGVVCCRRRRQCPKRNLHPGTGQSNPLFRSGSARGSPRLGGSQISQPTFVESSATQACRPLLSALPLSRTAAPCRPAPQRPVKGPGVPHSPPVKGPVVPQPPPFKGPGGALPSKPETTGSLAKQPTAVQSKVASFEAKPLAPSRPLPPIGTKPIKPTPPVPPVKPCGTSSPWKQQTQQPAVKVALQPPRKPR